MDEYGNNPPADDSVSGADGFTPEGNNGNVSPEQVLQAINNTTGRKYGNLEEAEKGLRETYNFVGKAGVYEKVVNTIADKLDLGGLDGVQEWLQSFDENKSAQPSAKSDSSTDQAGRLEELEFKADNPEMKPFLPFLKKIAKADGVSLKEAVKSEEFQEHLKLKQAQSNQPQSSVIESNQRVGFQSPELQDLAKRAQETGDISLKEELVAKAFGFTTKKK